jgi:hypothetical protein
MVNEALRQALELQAILVAARPHQNNTNIYRENRSPPHPMKRCTTIRVLELRRIGPLQERKTENNQCQKREGGPRRNKQELLRRSKWRPRNNREMSRYSDQRSRAGRTGRMPAYALKPPHYALTDITGINDISLVTQGWVGNKPCRVTVDTGAYVTVARPDIATGWPERQPHTGFTLQTVWGIPTHLKRSSADSHPGVPPAKDVGVCREHHR